MKNPIGDSNKKRTTITISPELHAKAVAHAENVHYTDFSGLVTALIVADLRGEHPNAAVLHAEGKRQASGKKAKKTKGSSASSSANHGANK